jgi:hypothetical protein
MINATAFFAVDRLPGGSAILIGDDRLTHQVPRADLPPTLEEGSVLAVPLNADGSPRWSGARLDPAERRRRLDSLGERRANLSKDDPGGDVVL